MIGLDTNVLIRYLTLDDSDQVAKVDRFLERVTQSGELLLIDMIVLCEVVWVLQASYGLSRAEVAEALRRILEARSFLVEDREIVRKAVRAFRTGSGDFADYLIGERNRRAGCRTTATLDKALRRSDLFELL